MPALPRAYFIAQFGDSQTWERISCTFGLVRACIDRAALALRLNRATMCKQIYVLWVGKKI
jgi:hypothetical protein